MRNIININSGWKFIREDAGLPASYPVQWTDVDLPHTWNATDGQDGGNDYYAENATNCNDGWLGVIWSLNFPHYLQPHQPISNDMDDRIICKSCGKNHGIRKSLPYGRLFA